MQAQQSERTPVQQHGGGTVGSVRLQHRSAMASEHRLQHCPLQDTLWKTTWPEGSASDGEAVRGPGSPKDCPLQDTL